MENGFQSYRNWKIRVCGKNSNPLYLLFHGNSVKNESAKTKKNYRGGAKRPPPVCLGLRDLNTELSLFDTIVNQQLPLFYPSLYPGLLESTRTVPLNTTLSFPKP